MKTEEEIQKMLGTSITNAIRSGSMEELRFFQGQIDVLENLLGLQKDAFSEDRPDHSAEMEKKE